MSTDDETVDVPGTASDEMPDIVDAQTVSTTVEADPDSDTVSVTRTAAFAEVAERPKQRAITDESIKNDVKFFDDLITFDAELSGTLHAQSQAAAAGPGVTHPAMTALEDDRTPLEEDITADCKQLLKDLNIDRDGATFFLNLLAHGNDVNFIEYEEGDADGEGGVIDLKPLPLRALTILDEETYQNRHRGSAGMGTPSPSGLGTTTDGVENVDEVITDTDRYVVNEGNSEHEDDWPAHDILHLALNRRTNWHTDHKGRATYGVWGERRLEAIRYSLQAKQNTLANKVAMDDKLLAREYFYINVEELFGHIDDPDRRLKKAREYAKELRSRIETLDADQKPILPEEVNVEIEGPDGDTARTMSDFIQTMNDSLQHALNYHVGAFGRDAGGTDRANRPAKDMSDNSVRHLRKIVKAGFRRLFKIHAMLRYEQAREVVDSSAVGVQRYELADDVRLPELTFDPVDPQEQVEKIRNAISGYEKGILHLNEARVMADHEPLTADAVEEAYWFRNPTAWADDDEEDNLYKNQQLPESGEEPAAESPDSEGPGSEDQTNGSPSDDSDGDGDEPSGNRRTYPTDSVDALGPYDTDAENWDEEGDDDQ